MTRIRDHEILGLSQTALSALIRLLSSLASKLSLDNEISLLIRVVV